MFNCPDNISSCDPVVTFVSPSGFDDCGTITLYQTDTTNLMSGDAFPVGITNLNYVATDLVGNQASCSVEIEIFALPEIDAGDDLQIDEGSEIRILMQLQTIVLNSNGTTIQYAKSILWKIQL